MKGQAQNSKQKQPVQTKDYNKVFIPQAPMPLRKLAGVKTYPQGTSPPENFLQLEKVIGQSSKSSTSIAVNPVTGEIAYPAGAIICIYNPKENKQTKFLYSMQLQRSYSCLVFSPDGKYLASGEGAFKQPEITIWEIDKEGDYKEIKHLRGHKYGIESVMFSPNMLYLISLGDANDRGLFVWEWQTESRVTSNKLGKPVNTFAFSPSNSFFVTAGYQHLKYWYFDQHGKVQKSTAQGQGNTTESIMESKSADFNKVKVKIFIGVQCIANGGQSGKEEQVLALATDGHLYVYDKNRKLTKWMNIKVDRALSCVLGGDHLYCACNDGIVRIFSSKSLEHIMTLPKPPPLGSANVESGNKKIRIPASKDSRFADALAVLIDEKNQRVVVLYSDKMIFIWDVRQMDKISVYRTLYSHCGPIYDLQFIPNSLPIGFQTSTLDGGKDGETPSIETLSEDELNSISKFATCSADRTIRFWNFIDPSGPLKNDQVNKLLVRNAYCKDMSKMIYVSNLDPRDPQNNSQNPQSQFEQFKVRPLMLNEDGSSKTDLNILTSQQRELEQLRCIRISPDGKHLACGDWTGNIRIHDLSNTNTTLYSTYDEIQCIQAHESEVVCLDYSPINYAQSDKTNIYLGMPSDDQKESLGQPRYWLASGSRDRLTHIYECNPNAPRDSGQVYKNVSILDDHSSTITSIKFAEEKSANQQKRRMKLISSGADKQIVIRNMVPSGSTFVSTMSGVTGFDITAEEGIQTQLLKKEQCKHKVLSMDVSGGYAISGHDKYVQLWQVTTTQSTGFDRLWDRKADSQKKSAVLDHIRVLFGPTTSTGLGHPQQPGCEIVIASCADKTVTIYETATGNAVCRTTCGEVTTAMCLSTNLKHLITTSMDGIIYIWKLPESLTKALIKLRSEYPLQSTMKLKTKGQSLQENLEPDQTHVQLNKSEEFDFKLDFKLDDADVVQPAQIFPRQPPQEELFHNQASSYLEDESSMMDNYQGQNPASISMIMKQINKVTTQIEKIQPLRPRAAMTTSTLAQALDVDDQPQILQNEPVTFQEPPVLENISAPLAKRRNAWNPQSRSPKREQEHADFLKPIEDDTPEPRREEIDIEEPAPLQDTIRPLQVKENQLPRWAQSTIGVIVDPSRFQQDERRNQAEPFSVNEQDQNEQEIEEIFSNTIEKQLSKEAQQLDPLSGGVKQGVFYGKIDEEEDESEERKSQKHVYLSPNLGATIGTDEPDELVIKEQLRMKNLQHKPMLGLDESDESGEEGMPQVSQRSSNNRKMRRPTEQNRQSQSQIFLQKKQQLIQNSSQEMEGAKNEQHQHKGEQLEVEDIFNEDAPIQESQINSQEVITEPNFLGQAASSHDRYKHLLNTLMSESDASDFKRDVEEQKLPPITLPQHSMVIDDSIMMSDRSMVKVNEKPKKENKGPEQEINRVLQEEIAKINDSLAKISQCLNTAKVEDSQTTQLTVTVREDVCHSLNNSINLWNTIAATLGTKPVPLPTVSDSQAYFVSPGKATSNTMPPQMGPILGGTSLSSIAPSSSGLTSQTLPLSQSISIKDDARDLLERYSDMLLAEVLRKINMK